MHNSVVATHPELWHYTTASGLQGILASQQLWATNIFYLNDKEEYTGFFDHKLLRLLQDGVDMGIAAALKTDAGRDTIEKKMGEHFLKEKFAEILLNAIRNATHARPAYVTSFCFTPPGQSSDDGLLSQWRGYGADGGYAIVFDTKGLNELLEEESMSYHYALVHWGDVDYYDQDAKDGFAHNEARQWENAIREAIAAYIQTPSTDLALSQEVGDAIYGPIFYLASRHKHRGFREELEVRIAVVRMDENLIEAAQAEGSKRLRKPIAFVQRGGMVVPYVALFQRQADEAAKLPIKKIIVGPHPEKLKRKAAIEMLLAQSGIDAQVIASDIPYIGR